MCVSFKNHTKEKLTIRTSAAIIIDSFDLFVNAGFFGLVCQMVNALRAFGSVQIHDGSWGRVHRVAHTVPLPQPFVLQLVRVVLRVGQIWHDRIGDSFVVVFVCYVLFRGLEAF